MGRLDPRPHRLVVAALAHDMRQIREEPVQRQQALARSGGKFALAADGANIHIETARAGALSALYAENHLRELVDLALDALDPIGLAVDDRFQQTGQNDDAGNAGRIFLVRTAKEDLE